MGEPFSRDNEFTAYTEVLRSVLQLQQYDEPVDCSAWAQHGINLYGPNSAQRLKMFAWICREDAGCFSPIAGNVVRPRIVQFSFCPEDAEKDERFELRLKGLPCEDSKMTAASIDHFKMMEGFAN